MYKRAALCHYQPGAMADRIIFHIPWKLAHSRSASQLRPRRMLQAFRDAGFAVDAVMGDRRERAAQVRRIAANLRRGVRYAFCYSESSTGPTLVATPVRGFWSAPLVDYRFFALLYRHGIPLGLFLRDIYWRFPVFYRENPRIIRRVGLLAGYWLDLLVYKRYVRVLFLPSAGIRAHIPALLRRKRALPLPPGADQIALPERTPRLPGAPLRAIYVGGIGRQYNLHAMFEAAARTPQLELTVCVRKDEWQQEQRSYRPFLRNAPNITIIHEDQEAVARRFADQDVGMLFVEPSLYRSFAMPYKLFEYLTYRLPIIASANTAAGDFVHRNGCGWIASYRPEGLVQLVERLVADPQSLGGVTVRVADVAQSNSWDARARGAVQALWQVER